MTFLSELLIYLLISAFLQNVIFTRTLGVSRIHTNLSNPQKILLLVESSTWVSSPMTVSYCMAYASSLGNRVWKSVTA